MISVDCMVGVMGWRFFVNFEGTAILFSAVCEDAPDF